MGKPKFSARQIGSILNEADEGIPVAEILITYGISGTTSTGGDPNMAALRHRNSSGSRS